MKTGIATKIGTCIECDGAYEAGERIVLGHAGRNEHVRCSEERARAIYARKHAAAATPAPVAAPVAPAPREDGRPVNRKPGRCSCGTQVGVGEGTIYRCLGGEGSSCMEHYDWTNGGWHVRCAAC